MTKNVLVYKVMILSSVRNGCIMIPFYTDWREEPVHTRTGDRLGEKRGGLCGSLVEGSPYCPTRGATDRMYLQVSIV